jgi:small subunit ribosomal protein S15
LEVQVARLTARIQQISSHLAVNKKDFSARRGLEAVLNQRKSLLRYVYRLDR